MSISNLKATISNSYSKTNNLNEGFAQSIKQSPPSRYAKPKPLKKYVYKSEWPKTFAEKNRGINQWEFKPPDGQACIQTVCRLIGSKKSGEREGTANLCVGRRGVDGDPEK